MRPFLRNLGISFAFLASLWGAAPASAQQMPPTPDIAAKAWLLLEVGSGQVLASVNGEQRVEPASLTKLMTAYLTFSALHQRVLSLNQTIPVSENAWKAQGSRMFVEPNKPVTVEELIQGMIVQSGNDACIALAEAIAGSEARFADMMNQQAAKLGMKNTHFMNPTGLPDPQHYTTARDLSLLATAIIRDFPAEYAKYYSMKQYRYNNITQPNRNRLLWADPSVDGMKTGHTESAGYCLIASAKRDGRRLLSVVLGTTSDGARAGESQKVLNFGYQYYDAPRLFARNQAAANVTVFKGQSGTVKAGFPYDFAVAVPKGFGNRIQTQIVPQKALVAPVKAGQRVGTLKLTLDGKPYGEFALQALEDVPLGGFFTRLWDSIRLWFQ